MEVGTNAYFYLLEGPRKFELRINNNLHLFRSLSTNTRRNKRLDNFAITESSIQ